MRFALGLLLALSIPTQAWSADYVEYVFRTHVTGTSFDYQTNSFVAITPHDRFYTFVVPLDGYYGSLSQTADSASYQTASNYFNGDGYSNAGVNSGGFGFLSAAQTFGAPYTSMISFSVATTPAIANAFTTSFTPFTSGHFEYFASGHGGLDNWTGTLVGFNARYRDGTPSFVGFADGATFAVPELATWVMMITGFGLVGRTMRRRRAKVTSGCQAMA